MLCSERDAILPLLRLTVASMSESLIRESRMELDDRSTKVLFEAAALASQGQHVLVVGHHFEHIQSLCKAFLSHHGGYVDGVSLVARYKGGTVTFQTPQLLNWETLRFPWAEPDRPVLIDPLTIEQQFPKMLEQFRRFG